MAEISFRVVNLTDLSLAFLGSLGSNSAAERKLLEARRIRRRCAA
jgi:hypothetical protein